MIERYILNARGEPVECPDSGAWASWQDSRRDGSNTAWIVGKTQVGEGVEVSTVFMTHDHDFSGKGPPVLWETLVFGGVLDGEMDRYCTRAEAEAGHKEMVERVKAAEGAVR